MERPDTMEEVEEINVLEDESNEEETHVEKISEENISENTNQIETSKGPKIPKQNQNAQYSKFPFLRVKRIMKMDPEVTLVEKDAVHLVSKATELFIEYLSREAGKQIGKRKTLMKRDIDVVIENVPHLCFLDGALE